MKHLTPLCLLLLILTACSTGYTPHRLNRIRQIPVTITFPAAKAQSISWIDTAGILQHTDLSPSDARDTASVTLSLPATLVTPVLVTYGGSDHPLGCVYPGDAVCTVAGGWAAHILRQFLKKTPGTNIRQYAGCFNWKKLTAAAAKLDDPWSLDEEAILTAINDGTFDTSLVNRPKNR